MHTWREELLLLVVQEARALDKNKTFVAANYTSKQSKAKLQPE
jgi:hypothetical protein